MAVSELLWESVVLTSNDALPPWSDWQPASPLTAENMRAAEECRLRDGRCHGEHVYIWDRHGINRKYQIYNYLPIERVYILKHSKSSRYTWVAARSIAPVHVTSKIVGASVMSYIHSPTPHGIIHAPVSHQLEDVKTMTWKQFTHLLCNKIEINYDVIVHRPAESGAVEFDVSAANRKKIGTVLCKVANAKAAMKRPAASRNVITHYFK